MWHFSKTSWSNEDLLQWFCDNLCVWVCRRYWVGCFCGGWGVRVDRRWCFVLGRSNYWSWVWCFWGIRWRSVGGCVIWTWCLWVEWYFWWGCLHLVLWVWECWWGGSGTCGCSTRSLLTICGGSVRWCRILLFFNRANTYSYYNIFYIAYTSNNWEAIRRANMSEFLWILGSILSFTAFQA